MRKLIILSLCLFTTIKIFSQKNSNFLKLHAGAEIPVGFFGEGYTTSFGIHATDYLETGAKGSILFTAGYMSLKDKIGQGIKSDLFLMKIGYRIFATEAFYFQVDAAGIGLYLDSYNQGTRFTYAGGIGYLIANKNEGGVDLSGKFNRIAGRSWISLHVGYQFKLGS